MLQSFVLANRLCLIQHEASIPGYRTQKKEYQMAHEHPPLNQSIHLPYWHFSTLYTYIYYRRNLISTPAYHAYIKSLLNHCELSNKNISQTHKNKKNTVILYALFTKDMSSEPLNRHRKSRQGESSEICKKNSGISFSLPWTHDTPIRNKLHSQNI